MKILIDRNFASMNLPEIYSNILEADKSLKGIVYSTQEAFAEILTENKLYFFEEYTDHGIKHVEAVLQTSHEIVPETMLCFFDSENVAALILSVLLHDIGMHHTYKSFLHLITQTKPLIPELDDFSWSELWENYTGEAKKFTSQQKNDIFGDYDYVVTIPNFKDSDDLDGHQKKLIGEFLRRHHPRIAHEIALCGLETGVTKIEFAEKYEKDKRDIVGLIARSHGMDIRDTYQYLQTKFFRLSKTPCGIHVYYLMTILRIADYFQIDIKRLWLASLKLKTFRSPVSEIEHNKHFAIHDIQSDDEDPETLFIRAYPETNFIYWKLIDLIHDIQNELDRSWAILGEKYGRDKIKPLLKYRRIVSNLNEKNYLNTISFIPKKIQFSSDPDLAKLLVEPLYGNNPTYGVRELLQNAVDAIHERTFFEKLESDFFGEIEMDIRHDSSEKWFFQIMDNGKGMSIQEIKNYFLKAGATNRKSKEWDKYLDENRNSYVLKSGKFGVGILSAFLIGDELEIKTRRLDSKTGLHFKVNINSKDVEVNKIQDCAIGTIIKIEIKKDALEFFKNPSDKLIAWDKWYRLSHPIIKYNSFLEYNKQYGCEEIEPSYFESDKDWIEFPVNGYSKLRWSYANKANKNTYNLSANGIVVPNPPKITFGGIPSPNIQVFDFNGLLPINLNRNSLDSDKLPFEKELIYSIFEHILKQILKVQPYVIIDSLSISLQKKYHLPPLFGGLKVDRFFIGFSYTSSGYCLKNHSLNNILKNHKLIKLNLDTAVEINKLSLALPCNFVLEIGKIEIGKNNDVPSFANTAIYQQSRKGVEWAIYSQGNNEYKSFQTDKGYKVYTRNFFSKTFFFVKRNDIKIIPDFINNMSNMEILSIFSLTCYSRISYLPSDTNSEFNNYLAGIFNVLGDAMIPYDANLREEKINQILAVASSSNRVS